MGNHLLLVMALRATASLTSPLTPRGIDLVALVEVYSSPGSPLKAGVEEPLGIFQGSSLGEGDRDQQGRIRLATWRFLPLPNWSSGHQLRQSLSLSRKGRELLQPLQAGFFLLRADYPPTDGFSIGCRLCLKETPGGFVLLQ